MRHMMTLPRMGRSGRRGSGDPATFRSRIPEGKRAVFIQSQDDVADAHAVGYRTSLIKSAGHTTGGVMAALQDNSITTKIALPERFGRAIEGSPYASVLSSTAYAAASMSSG